jgi:hypothetical protein
VLDEGDVRPMFLLVPLRPCLSDCQLRPNVLPLWHVMLTQHEVVV